MQRPIGPLARAILDAFKSDASNDELPGRERKRLSSAFMPEGVDERLTRLERQTHVYPFLLVGVGALLFVGATASAPLLGPLRQISAEGNRESLLSADGLRFLQQGKEALALSSVPERSGFQLTSPDGKHLAVVRGDGLLFLDGNQLVVGLLSDAEAQAHVTGLVVADAAGKNRITVVSGSEKPVFSLGDGPENQADLRVTKEALSLSLIRGGLEKGSSVVISSNAKATGLWAEGTDQFSRARITVQGMDEPSVQLTPERGETLVIQTPPPPPDPKK